MIGLMRRQHVIIGADNGNIGPVATQHGFFVMHGTGGKSMRLIARRKIVAALWRVFGGGDIIQIMAARRGRARNNAFGDLVQFGAH